MHPLTTGRVGDLLYIVINAALEVYLALKIGFRDIVDSAHTSGFVLIS